MLEAAEGLQGKRQEVAFVGHPAALAGVFGKCPELGSCQWDVQGLRGRNCGLSGKVKLPRVVAHRIRPRRAGRGGKRSPPRPLIDACGSTGSTTPASAPWRDADGREYIATLAVTGEGAEAVYAKMHLHGAEGLRFTPGEKPVVFEVDGRRLGLAVCRDAAVPEHAAQTTELGIDAYVAGTLYGEGREQSARRDTHMRARAHGVWVVLSTAAEPSREYQETSGGSGVRSPGGSLVAQSGSAPGEVLTLVLGWPGAASRSRRKAWVQQEAVRPPLAFSRFARNRAIDRLDAGLGRPVHRAQRCDGVVVGSLTGSVRRSPVRVGWLAARGMAVLCDRQQELGACRVLPGGPRVPLRRGAFSYSLAIPEPRPSSARHLRSLTAAIRHRTHRPAPPRALSRLNSRPERRTQHMRGRPEVRLRPDGTGPGVPSKGASGPVPVWIASASRGGCRCRLQGQRRHSLWSWTQTRVQWPGCQWWCRSR